MSTDVSEEDIASIFRVEEKVKQETIMLCLLFNPSFEVSVDFLRTTRRYITEEIILNHRCENPKYVHEVRLVTVSNRRIFNSVLPTDFVLSQGSPTHGLSLTLAHTPTDYKLMPIPV
jgi:hypothetical protein